MLDHATHGETRTTPPRAGLAATALATALVAILAAAAGPARAGESAVDNSRVDHSHVDHSRMDHGAAAGDPHAAHRAAANAGVQVSSASYEIPDLVLRDQQGKAVRLRELLAGDDPLVLNFIYTSCTTLCPVMTATMLQLQRQLQGSSPQPRYVSLSIDPDFDSSVVLRGYAARMHADWTFLTGEREPVQAALQAFSAWRGAKTNHFALTLMRRPGERTWTRVEGLGSASQLADLWRNGPT